MSLGDKVKAMRLEHSMTQRELGKYLNVTELSVRCWENGTKNPSMGAILALSELFKVSTDYLLGASTDETRDKPILNQQEIELLTNYRVLDDYGRMAVDALCAVEKLRIDDKSRTQVTQNNNVPVISRSPCRYIPRYITPSAAGYSAPLDGDSFEMMLVDDNVPYDADFAVRIQGDSMSPYIKDGETVYVKKDCELSVGDVGIFCVDGAMYCKQYYIDSERNLTLVSANPDLKHTNIYIDVSSGSDVRCYGKVILNYHIGLPDYLLS